MVASIADYVGRTIDLAAYHGVSPRGRVQLVEALAPDEESGAVVTGVQKVAQRFLVELLRETGSTPFRPEDGTSFLTDARTGQFRTQADVMGAFARGVVEVRGTLQAEELETDPDDERFVDATVTDVLIAPGQAVIRFQLVTAAGAARQFIFPLNIPVS
jgi:hypothetical protein